MIPKYRAWIKPQKRMVLVAGLIFDAQKIQVEVPREGKENISVSLRIEPNNYEFWYKDTEAILMQYTGLKDCKGKEIYEGDIVKFSGTQGDTAMAIVEFYNGRFIFGLNKNAYKDISGWRDVKVVGNKYTHPELMPK